MLHQYVLALVAFLAFVLLLAAGISVPNATAHAATTFTVTTTADGTDANPGDGVCETASGNGVCTLRAAVQEANALGGPDVINVPTGTHTLTIGGADDASAVGDLDVTDDLTITGAGAAATIIDGNSTHRVLHLTGDISLELSHVTIRNGFTDRVEGGAGIYNPDSSLSVNYSILTNNEADADGGGIHNEATLSLSNTTVSDNAAMRGGGIANSSTGVMTATAGTLAGNAVTEFGGGLYTSGEATLQNVTVSGNDANSNGGGIYISLVNARVTVTNSTFVTNTVGSGSAGGINNLAGTVTLKNTIVSDNAGDNCNGNVTSAGHNLESTDTCEFDQPGDLVNTNPKLGPLQDNGAATETHALLPDSPAIDAGDNIGCPATDQRGESRPIDGNFDGAHVCDIGAVEYSPTVYSTYLPAIVKE